MKILIVASSIFAWLKRDGAYLDPGSGSFFLQVLLAALLGALFVLRTYWAKIKQALSNLFNRHKPGDVDETE
ncbi:MAG: hypothetical protein HN413_17510 [Chloroflexi bacterium]|jgi:hypothetical protein|nr:hypothetical protein [Chloroflexota bacterium]